jgi:micrococcal nuclease
MILSKNKWMNGYLLAGVIFLISSSAGAKNLYSGVVSHVTDGDTLWVQPATGGAPRKLRIDGVDAPEICQTGGEAARVWLSQQVLGKHVEVAVRRNDVYGRGLAKIRVTGKDLGATMVGAGQAWSYRWRRDAGPYAAEEAKARALRQGLFALDRPELPRDFRKRHGSCHVSR